MSELKLSRDWPFTCEDYQADLIEVRADIGFDESGEPVATFRGVEIHLDEFEKDECASWCENYFPERDPEHFYAD